MRAADVKPHVGLHVVVHTKGDVVYGSGGTIHIGRLSRVGIELVNDKGLQIAALPLSHVVRIIEFTTGS